MPRISGFAVVLLCCVVTCGPTPAAAESGAAVETLVGQADKAMVSGDYQAVLGYVDQLRALQKQGATVPPRVFEQESRAAQSLDDPVRAKAAVDSYLAIASPSDSYYAEAIRLYPELQRKITALSSEQASKAQLASLQNCLTNANPRQAERYCRSWLAAAKRDDPRRAEVEARMSKLQADRLAEESARTAASFEKCTQAPTAAAAQQEQWRDMLHACNAFLHRALADDPKRSAATARRAELTEAAGDACLQATPQPPDPRQLDRQMADCHMFLNNAPPQDPRRAEAERRKTEVQDALLAPLHDACMVPGPEPTIGIFDKMIESCGEFLLRAPKEDPRRDQVTGQEQKLKDTLLRGLFEICTQGTGTTPEQQQQICRQFLLRAPRDDLRRQQVQVLMQPGK